MARTIFLLIPMILAVFSAQADELPSWNDGPVKTAILEWVAAVTDPDSEDFIPVPERIAVFDNDGTSSCERPRSLTSRCQLALLGNMAERGEIDSGAMPISAWLAEDRDALRAFGWPEAYRARNAAFAGWEVTAFADSVRNWVAGSAHPKFGVPYTELYYPPMTELRDLLAAHDFKVWIVTGSTQAVIRAISESAIGVPPERVIGSTSDTEFVVGEDGVGRVVRAEDQMSNTYENKPPNIETRIGRRPVFSAGNSNNDEPMSRYVMTGPHLGFALWIHHDDPEREYEYHWSTDDMARLVEEQADAHEVSVKSDWVKVFLFDE
jgi:phosphoserine phosphatase